VLSQVAWPLDVVYDSNNKFCGFVMPELNINDELGEIYKYPSSLSISMQQKLIIAENICAVISEVHKAGYVFGDFNPRNIGVDKNSGTVAFLDTDSYHLVDTAKNIEFRCVVYLPGYMPPELIDKYRTHLATNPSDKSQFLAKLPLPTFSRETDNFALAIHIFKLLFNGYTPYGGIIETDSASQSSPGMGDTAVERDNYCFKPGFKHQAVAIPTLDSFPQEISDLFTRAFMFGRLDPKQRPIASEWHSALENFEKNLTTCRRNILHQYDKNNTECPLCEADERYKLSMAPQMAQKAFTPIVQAPTYTPTPQTSRSSVGTQSLQQKNWWQSFSKKAKIAMVAVTASVTITTAGLVFNAFGGCSISNDPQDVVIPTVEPTHQNVVSLEESNRAYQAGLQAMANRNYELAITEFRKVVELDENYGDAQLQLTEAITLYKDELFSYIVTLEESESYTEIINKLNIALNLLPNDSEITNKISHYENELERLNRAYVTNRLSEIRDNADTLDEIDEGLTELKALLSNFPEYSSFINEVISDFTATLINGVTVNLSDNTLHLPRGESETLSFIVNPSVFRNLELTWNSSNTSIATVSNSGLVTATGAGSADISITASDGTIMAICDTRVTIDFFESFMNTTRYSENWKTTREHSWLFDNGEKGLLINSPGIIEISNILSNDLNTNVNYVIEFEMKRENTDKSPVADYPTIFLGKTSDSIYTDQFSFAFNRDAHNGFWKIYYSAEMSLIDYLTFEPIRNRAIEIGEFGRWDLSRPDDNPFRDSYVKISIEVKDGQAVIYVNNIFITHRLLSGNILSFAFAYNNYGGSGSIYATSSFIRNFSIKID
jgi:serine/threonine protein kinase